MRQKIAFCQRFFVAEPPVVPAGGMAEYIEIYGIQK
jgi:hypothetical protein